MTNARKRELEQYRLTEAKQDSARDTFAGLETEAQILNKAQELDRQGIPGYIIAAEKSKALRYGSC